jgi:hypothetical protein
MGAAAAGGDPLSAVSERFSVAEATAMAVRLATKAAIERLRRQVMEDQAKAAQEAEGDEEEDPATNEWAADPAPLGGVVSFAPTTPGRPRAAPVFRKPPSKDTQLKQEALPEAAPESIHSDTEELRELREIPPVAPWVGGMTEVNAGDEDLEPEFAAQSWARTCFVSMDGSDMVSALGWRPVLPPPATAAPPVSTEASLGASSVTVEGAVSRGPGDLANEAVASSMKDAVFSILDMAPGDNKVAPPLSRHVPSSESAIEAAVLGADDSTSEEESSSEDEPEPPAGALKRPAAMKGGDAALHKDEAQGGAKKDEAKPPAEKDEAQGGAKKDEAKPPAEKDEAQGGAKKGEAQGGAKKGEAKPPAEKDEAEADAGPPEEMTAIQGLLLAVMGPTAVEFERQEQQRQTEQQRVEHEAHVAQEKHQAETVQAKKDLEAIQAGFTVDKPPPDIAILLKSTPGADWDDVVARTEPQRAWCAAPAEHEGSGCAVM